MLNASKTVLPDVLAAHGRWVASGGKEGERADFSGAMLEEIDLAAAELDIARFRRANLRRANLSGAHLKGADLKEAELHTANLQNANLIHADFESAFLIDAGLQGADLRQSNLHKASLLSADLRHANLKGANLRGAFLQGADLRKANLQNADLQDADLHGAYLQGADLDGADIARANLEEAHLHKVRNLPKESLRRARNWRKAHRETEYRPQGVIAAAAGAVLIGIAILVTGVSGLFGESAGENSKSAKARQEKVAASGSKGASQQAMAPAGQRGSPADPSTSDPSMNNPSAAGAAVPMAPDRVATAESSSVPPAVSEGETAGPAAAPDRSQPERQSAHEAAAPVPPPPQRPTQERPVAEQPAPEQAVPEQSASEAEYSVATMQQLLNQLGYEAGPPDGRVGGRTRGAVRAYQRDHGLAATGRPGPDLFAYMQQQGTKEPSPPAQRKSAAADATAPKSGTPASEAGSPESGIKVSASREDDPLFVLLRDSNVRAKPLTKSKSIGTLPRGTQVAVSDETKGWYRVEYRDGVFGYVYSKLMRKVEDKTASGARENGAVEKP